MMKNGSLGTVDGIGFTTAAMNHHPSNQERAINLSILPMSGPGKFPRVESN